MMSQDNININVQETNDIVNIVSSEVTEVIDINVSENAEEITLNITEEIVQVNINKVTNVSAVTSVNGEVGNVVLDIPTNTSDLINDSGFITAAEVPTVNDATSSVKGILKLTNDLGGTADLPTVPALANKVDKITGKGLSTNDYTTAEKSKLAGIADGAEVNVNADWNATSGDAQILNKPNLSVYGDMFKSTYDVDNTGVVDNAEAIKIIGRNSTGNTLYKGTIIYINGSTGNRPNFVKAQANSEATSAGTFGVIADDLANNSDGYALCLGYLDTLDTRTNATHPFTSDTLADGDTIYLSPTTAGYITNVKPSAPNHLVYLGKVTRTSPSLGTIVYRIQNGYELEELHNVAISSVSDKQLLSYDSATSLWKNKSVTTADIAASTNKNYVTDAQAVVIGNTSGVNTGDQDLSNLVIKNATITGATKTKITYDSKGLVTGGADATTADIADSTNKRYVTDANLTTIGNQSGTNTGDETATTIKSKLGITTLSGSNTGDQDLSGLVTKTTTVNSKALSSNIVLTTADIADSTGKRYQTENQNTYNDATSSIQTQLNAKQGTLTLTTSGTSGASTLVGNTLNIPQYSGGGGTNPIKLTSQTLTAASWSLSGGYYTYTFSNVNIDTTCDVSVTPQNASYLTAYNAQVLPFVGVAAGVATFYSQFPPQDDMVVDIVITQTT